MKIVLSMLIGMAIPFFLASGSVQAAEPVAMVTDLTGNAWLLKEGKQERLNVLSYLNQGGRVRLDSKASISITAFNPAAVYSISGPAKLELVSGEVHVISGSSLERSSLDQQKANAGRQFSAIQRERLAMAAVRMRGFGLRLMAPVNGELLNVHPTFTWAAPNEAKSFVVTITDESEEVVVSEATVIEPTWQLPTNLSLQHGHRYSWEVRILTTSGKEVADSGEFAIIDEERSRQILKQKPSVNASFSDRVLYALLLESEGLEIDAADEWKLLAEERPNEQLLEVHLQKH
jgi:hypothetical protein